MSVKGREIDENGYVIIEPLIQIDIDKNTDLNKYNRYYHREYYKKFLSLKVECPLCGCSIRKEKIKRHQQSSKCHKMRASHNIEDTEDKPE